MSAEGARLRAEYVTWLRSEAASLRAASGGSADDLRAAGGMLRVASQAEAGVEVRFRVRPGLDGDLHPADTGTPVIIDGDNHVRESE